MPKTVKDLQRVTGLGENLIRAAIRTGELPGFYVGHRITIPDEAFDLFCKGAWVPRPRPIFAEPVKPIVAIRRRNTA